MESKNIKFLIIIYLIGAFPLALLGSSNVFANSPMFNNQSFSVKGVDFYFEDFTDQTYKAGATTAWGWGGGQLTNERNFSYITQDFYATSSICKGIDIQGRKAYLVVDHPIATDCLEILDITSPAFMIQMSSRSSYSEMISIKIHGDYIYAGLNTSGQAIKTYNATDPTALGAMSGIYIDTSTVDGAVTDIETYGHLIYFTSFDSTSDRALRVIDASDPDNGNLITNNWANTKAHGLAIDGQLAYVAAAEEGFYALNISNKYSAIEYDHIPLPGFISDVVVDGRFAYVAAGEAGVHVVDIFNPHDMDWIGTIDTDGFARKLVKQGNTVYVACMDGGLFTLDVADPTNPSYVTKMIFGENVWDVDTFGNYIFIARDSGVTSVLAAADGGGLTNFGGNAYRSSFADYQCWDVQVQGDIAYVAAGTDGFYTLNVRDPINPILLDNVTISHSTGYRHIDVEGQYAYVIYTAGIDIFDIRDPANIVLVKHVIGGNLNDVEVEGELMYISYTTGISCLNVSDPTNPTIEANIIYGSDNLTSIVMQGHHLYTGNYAGAFGELIYCFDTIPDVFNPDELGTESRASWATNIHVDGDLAYLSDTTWLVIEDITDPSNPTFVEDVDWNIPGIFVKSFGATTFGTNIINAGGSDGVHFLDAIDITPTFFAGTNYADANSALKVTTHGDYTYVANKTSLVILRHFESPGDTYLSGGYTAESTTIDSVTELIYYATLNVNDYVPVYTNVDYYLSADGGAHWELVTPGVEHEFVNVGSDLRWHAELLGARDRSVHIFDLSIDFFFNEEPTIPVLTDPTTTATTSSFEVTWAASIDDAGIDHYELQIDDENTFTTLIDEFNVTGTAHTATGLTNGTYYFRVRAVDIYDLKSGWSNIADLDVSITALNLQWWHYLIIFGRLGLVILIIVIAVSVRKRKKATATR